MDGPGYEEKKRNVDCSGRPSSAEGILDLGFLSEPPEKLLKILVSRPCCQSSWGHDPSKCTRTICSSSAAFVVKIKGEIYSMKSIPHWTLLFSHSVQSNSLQADGLQHTRLPCSSLSPRACSNSCPLSWWCHPTISSSVVPFSPIFDLSKHQGLFRWICSSHQVAKVLEFQLQHQFFQWIFRTDFL